MTKTKLRKKLEALPKENVINVVMALYDASREARMYLDFYTTPNSLEEGKRFKKNHPPRVLPRAGIFRTTFICHMQKSHLRFQEDEASASISRRPHDLLHRKRLRIHDDLRRHVGAILHHS